MNRRKSSKGLTSKQRSFISDADHEAKRAGTPLTIWLTFTAPATVTSSPALLAPWFQKIRNKAGGEARRKGYTSAFVWTIEANPDGTNPHMNLAIHVPPEERNAFLKVATRWLPEGGVLWDDVDPDRDLIGYITKQLDHKASYALDLPYQPGIYVGKRCGATKSLMVDAIKGRSKPVVGSYVQQQNRAA